MNHFGSQMNKGTKRDSIALFVCGFEYIQPQTCNSYLAEIFVYTQ